MIWRAPYGLVVFLICGPAFGVPEIRSPSDVRVPEPFRTYPSVVALSDYTVRVRDEAFKVSMKVEATRDIAFETESHTIRLIQKTDAITLGDYSVAYDKQRDTVEILAGRRIRTLTDVLSISPSDVTHQSVDRNPEVVNYENIWKKSFSLPDVQVGDLVEFKTRRESNRKMGSQGFGDRYEFGAGSPVLFERVCYETSAKAKLQFKLIDVENSVIRLDEESRDRKIKRTCFVRENRAPEIFEPSTSSGRVYRTPVLLVTSWTSWEEFGRWLDEKYRGKFAADKAIQSLVGSLTQGMDTDSAIREIYHWVEKNIKYVQVYVNYDAGFVPASASEVLRRKFGDCKEKATLFIAMLRVIGVGAYPVLISMRSSGAPDADLDFPMQYQFNHMITYVEGINRFLDPVSTLTPYPYLVPQDKGRNVLVLRAGKLEKSRTPWIDVEDFQQERRSNIELNIDTSGSCTTEMLIQEDYVFRGMEASEWFGQNARSKEGLDRYMEDEWIKDSIGPEALLIEYAFDPYPLDDFSQPVSLVIRYRETLNSACYADRKPAFIMLPQLLSIPYFGEFSQARGTRVYPYTWLTEPRAYLSEHTIKLPPGYQIELRPRDIVFENAAGIFTYHVSYSLSGNTLSVREELRIRRVELEPTEFELVKRDLLSLSMDLKNRVLLKAVGHN